MKDVFRERRKHGRVLLSLPMKVQWTSEEGVMSSEDCKSINISTGGVYCKTLRELPVDIDATVTFDLPIEEADDSNVRMLRTRGRVVRIENTSVEEKCLALKFLDELKFSSSYND